MPIRFKCRNCKRPLRVPDNQAGRKSICPACRKPIIIPKPKPSAAQVDDLAASLFADGEEKKEVKPKVEAKPIKFNCEFCDEVVQVPLTEAGTKMPCPECKRIIRVPVPNEEKPKDWRDVAKKGPMGAKDNQPEELENAWGTEQARRVTGKALQEADAIPVTAEPRNLGIWLKRGFWGSVTIGFLYMAIVGMMRSQSVEREKRAMQDAVDLAKNLPADWAAEIHRAAGEMYCSKGKPVQAQREFQAALGSLARSQKKGVEVDLFLIDLALDQIELGGSEEEVIAKERLTWSVVQGDIGKTLESIAPDVDGAPGARGLAVRLVGTRLAEKKQTALATAIGLTGSLPAQQLGLFLAHKAALEIAAQDPDKELAKNAKKALDDITKRLQEKLPAAKADEPINPLARQANVEGLAHQRKYKEALALVAPVASQDAKDTAKCLEACVAGAELALANKSLPEASQFVQKALEMIKELQKQKAEIPPWLAFETVRAGIEADVADVQELAKTLDPSFQPYVQLLIFRQKLNKSTEAVPKVDTMSLEKDKPDMLCWPLAWEALARHNARHRRSREDVLALATAAQDDRVRAFLLVGFALGQHDGPK